MLNRCVHTRVTARCALDLVYTQVYTFGGKNAGPRSQDHVLVLVVLLGILWLLESHLGSHSSPTPTPPPRNTSQAPAIYWLQCNMTLDCSVSL